MAGDRWADRLRHHHERDEEVTETKPATFKQGVPKSQKNGIYGIEDELVAEAGMPIVAIVTFEIEKVILEEISDERYPVVAITHIEPLRDAKAAKIATGLLEDAYKVRTAEGALDLGSVD